MKNDEKCQGENPGCRKLAQISFEKILLITLAAAARQFLFPSCTNVRKSATGSIGVLRSPEVAEGETVRNSCSISPAGGGCVLHNNSD